MSQPSPDERMGIYAAGQDTAVAFARDELAAYLERMTGRLPAPAGRIEDARFVLGTCEDLAGLLGAALGNDRWQDAIVLKSLSGRLVLSGPNGRSVLFSVYAYLEDLGCRWLYPGPAGEMVPSGVRPRTDGFDRRETPSYRFRGMMAYPLAFEEGRDLVDWMAKRRMNYYFQEGFPADHPCRHGLESVGAEERQRRAAVCDRVRAEARRRGLLLNRFGHGWLDGVVDLYAREQHLSVEAAREALRARGTDAATKQLCLSHPDVQRLLVRHVCEFLELHAGEQDLAAVYMGDDGSVCRCERCQTRPFSAWYLDAIRRIVERLAHTAPRLTIEFACYASTLGAPRERLLDGLDHLVMIFAALGRCYRHTLRDPACRYADWKADPYHPEGELEIGRKPRNADFLEAYRAWHPEVSVPRYFADYFNAVIHKPGYHAMAYLPETLAEDVRGYAAEALEGGVSCQPCRAGFPTHVVNETFARLLWDKTGNARALRAAYLGDLFGPWAPAAERHMDAMRDAFLMLAPDEDVYVQQATDVILRVAAALDAIRAGFDAAFPAAAFAGPYAARLVLLKADLLFYRMLFNMVAACRTGQESLLPSCADEAQAYIREHQDELEAVMSTKPLLLTPDQVRQARFIKDAKFGYV